jgi:carbon-monoxide dehydrogenase medium subunit
MASNFVEYHRPKDWTSALETLRRPEVNTQPLQIGPRPEAISNWKADAVVDLSQLDLSYIKSEGGKVHIGALTPLQELAKSELLQSSAGGVLAQAAHLSAPLGIRNLAVLGGALTSKAGPPEVILALLALDAVVVIRSDGERGREKPLMDFLAAGAQLNRGEVLIEAHFPAANTNGGGLARVALTPRDEAIVAAIAVIQAEGGKVKQARLAVAPSSAQRQRFEAAEKLLEGQAFTPEQLEKAAAVVKDQAKPIADYRGSVEYRREMVAVLAKRALQAAWKTATGA